MSIDDYVPRKRNGEERSTCIPPNLPDGSRNPNYDAFLRGGPSVVSGPGITFALLPTTEYGIVFTENQDPDS